MHEGQKPYQPQDGHTRDTQRPTRHRFAKREEGKNKYEVQKNKTAHISLEACWGWLQPPKRERNLWASKIHTRRRKSAEKKPP